MHTKKKKDPSLILCWFEPWIMQNFNTASDKFQRVGRGAVQSCFLFIFKKLIPRLTRAHRWARGSFLRSTTHSRVDKDKSFSLSSFFPHTVFSFLNAHPPILQQRAALVNNWGIFPFCHGSFPDLAFLHFLGLAKRKIRLFCSRLRITKYQIISTNRDTEKTLWCIFWLIVDSSPSVSSNGKKKCSHTSIDHQLEKLHFTFF